MRTLSSPEDASQISNPHVRALIDLRIQQLGNFDDCEIVIVEPGDSLATLEKGTGCFLLTDPFTNTQYGDAEYSVSADAIEDHGHAYTLLFATTDEFVVEIFVSKASGMDATLLAYCAQYAVPATGLEEP